MRLYTRWQNSAGERVRIALHLKGLNYEYVPVGSLPAGRFGEINPQGLMPALEVNGRIVAQSTAILEWLEEEYPTPALLPSDAWRRAEARSFAQFITSDLHPLNNNRVRKYLDEKIGAGPDQIDDWYRHWISIAYDALERLLERRAAMSSFCFGETPGWADLHLVPQTANARRFGCDLSRYPLLTSIDKRCQTLESFRLARPEEQPDHPRNSN